MLPVDARMQRLRDWNAAYRLGKPLISDQEYDVELLDLEKLLPADVFQVFRQTLVEPSGSVRHAHIIGSLENVYPENELLSKRLFSDWLTRHSIQRVFVSAKVDGMSGVLDYSNGHPILGSTRGDGYTGERITPWKIQRLCPTLTEPRSLQVRCEFTLTGNTYKDFGFKNRRNGTVGIIKADSVQEARVDAVGVKAYQILGSDLPRVEQFQILEKLGFETPPHAVMDVTPNLAVDLEQLLDRWRAQADYDIDGLVVCDEGFAFENAYYPEKMVAFKTFKKYVETTVRGVELSVSKGGNLIPVLLLDPVEIDGTTVSRASGYNIQTVKTSGLGIGAKVGIHKAGEIIPEVTCVLEPAPVSLPSDCPSCGAAVSQDGVHLRCTSNFCASKDLERLEYFLLKRGVEGASKVSLRKWGLLCVEDLLTFRPDIRLKSQTTFHEQVIDKVLNCPNPEDLLGAMSFDNGGGLATVKRLLQFYGFDALQSFAADHVLPETYPPKIKSQTLQNILSGGWKRNVADVFKILEDPRRYSELPKTFQDRQLSSAGVDASGIDQESTGPLAGKTFLITGELSVRRKDFESEIVQAGGSILPGVTADLMYLIVGEKPGSKLGKAQKRGTVSIVDEATVRSMMATTTTLASAAAIG